MSALTFQKHQQTKVIPKHVFVVLYSGHKLHFPYIVSRLLVGWVRPQGCAELQAGSCTGCSAGAACTVCSIPYTLQPDSLGLFLLSGACYVPLHLMLPCISASLGHTSEVGLCAEGLGAREAGLVEGGWPEGQSDPRPRPVPWVLWSWWPSRAVFI